MYINKIQYNWTQDAGYCRSGPVFAYYNLFYFPAPVQIESDGKVICTRPNACVLYQPKHKRWFCLPERGAISWLHAYQEIAPLLKLYEIPMNQVFYPEDPELVGTLMERIHVEFYSGGRNREQMIDALVQTLVVTLSRNDVLSGEKSGGSPVGKRKMQELRALLLSQPDKKWNIAEMAREVSLSPSRFHTVYKAMFGATPGQDMIRGKMDHAKSLLLMDEYIPLATIAERLGYSSQYHFIRQFKQITGETPGAYRRKNK